MKKAKKKPTLEINRETLRNLDATQLSEANGAYWTGWEETNSCAGC